MWGKKTNLVQIKYIKKNDYENVFDSRGLSPQ